jgi:hypothetical protein
VTAGNASGINDGAAALVVSTARTGRGARPRRSRGSSRTHAGVDPMIMGMGPVRRCARRWSAPALARRHRPLRAERGLRRRSRWPSPRAGLDPRASTSTAAPSPWAIPSAPAAPACSRRWCTRCRRARAAAAWPRCASAAAWGSRWSSRAAEEGFLHVIVGNPPGRDAEIRCYRLSGRNFRPIDLVTEA